jgi:hypothetical protein
MEKGWVRSCFDLGLILMAINPWQEILVSDLKMKSPLEVTIFLPFLTLIFNENKNIIKKNKIECFCVYLE